MRDIAHTRKKINSYLLFIMLIIFGVYQFGIGKICGFTMVPDEFGYWASAAKNVGYDWSEVASLGSYYSFGYSFLLTPILWLFRDGVMAYRAAVTVNMILMCVGMFLICGITRRLFPETDQTKRIFVGGIAVFYPVWIFNMQMTMAEALIMFLFVLITYLFVCLIQEAKAATAVCLAASLAYIYCVHMRTAGVLIACMITLCLWAASKHPKMVTVFAFGVAFLVFAVCIAVMKQNTVTEVFSNADSQVLAGNDYGGQRGKLAQILNVRGMTLFIEEIIGKVFYLGHASFGLFYWGIGWTIKQSFLLFGKFLKKKEIKDVEWFSLFLLLAAIGEILISSIYMHPAGTVDALIYGRYDEFLIPVFLLVGVIAMGRSRWIFKGTLTLGIMTGLMAPLLLRVIKAKELTGLRGYMVAGISYLLDESNPDVPRFFKEAWALGIGIMFLTAFLVWFSDRGKNRIWILAGMIVIEVGAGLQISDHYVYQVNRSNFADLMVAEEISDYAGAEDSVVYLDEGNHPYIDFLQMQLRERPIKVITKDDFYLLEEGRDNAFVIVHCDSGYKEQLETMFDKCTKANTFYLYYNGKDAAFNEIDHTDPLL